MSLTHNQKNSSMRFSWCLLKFSKSIKPNPSKKLKLIQKMLSSVKLRTVKDGKIFLLEIDGRQAGGWAGGWVGSGVRTY